VIGKLDASLLFVCAVVGLGVSLADAPRAGPLDRAPERTTVRDDSTGTSGLEGSVILPPRQTDRRRYRGRAYRQRTNQGPRAASPGDAASPAARYRTVVVSVHPLSYDPAVEPMSPPVEVDQQDATFVPTVTPVTPGTTIEFVNSDPFYHNVFSLTPGARFNIGRRPTGVVVEETIPAVDGPVPGLGVVELHCDIHPQMNAFILSLQTPYFTRVGEDGTFGFDQLPAGRYRVHAFMPRQDVVSLTVELGEDERLRRTIDLR
jgi:plastocyanin